MKAIEISIQSDKKDIKSFLEQLHKVLNSETFDIDKDFIFIKSKKDKIEYSTPYLLSDLDYDATDVVDRLKELTVEHYSETLFDKDDDKPPLLYVFGMYIDGKLVYIKLKIKGSEAKRVLCLSFHYAERDMDFPYT